MKKYILAIDEGTTDCRAVLYDVESCRTVATHMLPVGIKYPRSGWVEQDANEIYTKQLECIRAVIGGLSADEIWGMGITNQRETVVIWRRDGTPLHAAITWQCRRTSTDCQRLIAQGYAQKIKQKTGLVIDAYFSATKLKWLLDDISGARELAAAGELFAGTVDSYLIYRMTNGARHITDITNAGRTMLCNIRTGEWDGELLELFDIPRAVLPQIVPCAGSFGEAEIDGKKIKICGIAGDQQAALFGQTCFEAGETKCTYGTGAFLLTNIGTECLISDTPLITTIACKIGDEVRYAFEGSVFNAGSTVQWLRNLGLINFSAESEECANKANPNSGVYLVPAFTGLGAPHWDMNARAAIVGLTRADGKNEIVRAGLESIAYRCGEVYELMRNAYGNDLGVLYADGGAAENTFLMQFQADILGVPVCKAIEKEATALGAAYLAGLGAGAYAGLEEINKKHKIDRTFTPSGADMSDKLAGWKTVVAMIKNGGKI